MRGWRFPAKEKFELAVVLGKIPKIQGLMAAIQAAVNGIESLQQQ
jgi:hypothetical protein